jgi:UPF0716 family protein affecting phage T7 exclusion
VFVLVLIGVPVLEVFVLVLIGVPVLEVFVFVEVGRAVGWLLAVVLLLGLSMLGVQLLRVQGCAAALPADPEAHASLDLTSLHRSRDQVHRSGRGRFTPGNRDMPP